MALFQRRIWADNFSSEFEEIQDRLNLINHLKDKYGRNISDIERARAEREERLAFLEDYENGRRKLQKEIASFEARLQKQDYSASVGVATAAIKGLNVNALITRVEEGMYEKKRIHYSGERDRRRRSQ